jgi:hypothetical protein
MTRSLPFTQASLRRAIEAVRKAGLSVTGIRPDGTLIVHESTHFIAGVAPIARPVHKRLVGRAGAGLDHLRRRKRLERAHDESAMGARSARRLPLSQHSLLHETDERQAADNFVAKKCPVCGVQYCLDAEFDRYRERGLLHETDERQAADNFVAKKCLVCGVQYCLDAEFDRYRERGAKDDDGSPLGWYCPNGHSLVYRESEADRLRLRRERDRLRQRLAQRDDEIKSLEAQRGAALGQVTKLRNRVGNGVCPCCSRSFTNLRRHMDTQHPDWKAEAAA